MGEEEKKAAEEEKKESKTEDANPKAEEPKKQEGPAGEEKPSGEASAAAELPPPPPPPPPPEEIEMRVFMHCEGCARKVRRCLRGFEGVEDVSTDSRTHKVVVKGKKAAEDPLKVVDRVQKKTGRKVDLLSPLPQPKDEEKKEEDKGEEKPKVEVKKEEPVVVTVVLRVHMHCEACAQDIKKRILKMKGVQSADPEIKASQVTVKGVFEPAKLIEYVYKRTGKHATIVKMDPDLEKKAEEEKEKEEEKAKDEKKPEEKTEKPEEGEKAEKEGGGDEKGEKKEGTVDEAAAVVAVNPAGIMKIEQKRNEFYYYYPRYPVEYLYPPQMFSDENPNACTVM